MVVAGHRDIAQRADVNSRSTVRRIVFHPKYQASAREQYGVALLLLSLPLGSGAICASLLLYNLRLKKTSSACPQKTL